MVTRYTGDLDFWVGTDPANAVHLDDFVTNKTAVGRLQDLADIAALKRLARGG